MYLIIMMIMLTILAIMIIMMLIPLINKHKSMDREKNSPFECGFDPFTNSRNSFSIHFFSISLMFLIFDIEITIIMPMPLIKTFMIFNNWITFCMLMIMLLMMGLILEWKEGSMEWK